MTERYDIYAKSWEGGSKLNGHYAEAKQFLSQLPGYPRQDFVRVLGCGAGTGVFEGQFMEDCPNAQVIAIDRSQAMLNEFGKKAEEKGYRQRLELIQGDIKLGLNALLNTGMQEEFDVAIAGGLFEHLDDLDVGDAASKIHKLLKRNGVLLHAPVRNNPVGWTVGLSCGALPRRRKKNISLITNKGFSLEKLSVLPLRLENWLMKWVKEAHYFTKKQ